MSESNILSSTLSGQTPEDKNHKTQDILAIKDKRQATTIENTQEINDSPIALKPFSLEWITEIRGSTAMIVGSISFAVFTDIFVYSVVVPVFPYVLQTRLGVSLDDLQNRVSQILALYSVGLIVGSILFGYIADKIPFRRLIMLIGLLILTGSTLLIFFAKSLPLYMVARVIQGLSASVVWVVGLAIVADIGDSTNIAYLMGYPGIGLSMGLFAGPLVGGIMYDRVGYNGVFYVCFGILAVDIILRLIMIEKSHLREFRRKRAAKLAKKGIDSLSPELQEYVKRYNPDNNRPNSTTITTTCQETNEDDNYNDVERQHDASSTSDPEKPSKPVCFYLNIFNKKFQIPAYFALLFNIRILNAFFLSIIMAWFLTAFEGILTIHLETTFHFNSLQAGLMFLAVAGPSFAEPIIGYLCDKFGPRYIVAGGLVLATPAFICLRFVDHNTAGQIALISVLLVIIGLCNSAIFAPVTAEFSNAVSKFESRNPGSLGKGKGFGQVYGIFNVGYSIGSLIGPFEAGGVVTSRGWGMAVLSLGLVSIISAFVTFPFTGGNLLKKRFPKSHVTLEM